MHAHVCVHTRYVHVMQTTILAGLVSCLCERMCIYMYCRCWFLQPRKIGESIRAYKRICVSMCVCVCVCVCVRVCVHARAHIHVSFGALNICERGGHERKRGRVREREKR
jgi:hypothetical protein